MVLFEDVVRILDDEKGDEASALRALAMAYQGYFMGWLDLSDQGMTWRNKV
jgi:hypothetical protein